MKGCFGKLKTELKTTHVASGIVRFDCSNNTRTSITLNLNKAEVVSAIIYAEEDGVYPIPPSTFVVTVKHGTWDVKDLTNTKFSLRFKVNEDDDTISVDETS